MGASSPTRLRFVGARRLTPAAVVLLVLVCAAPVGARTEQAVILASKPHAAVAAIAEPAVRVHCSIAPAHVGVVEVLGYADRSRLLIELQASVCRSVNGLARAPARPTSPASYRQAEALLVLVHEAIHVSSYEGRDDEALTECRAIQLVRESALTMGIDDATARALGHEAMRFDARLPGPENWMVGLREIPSYHAPGCHEGGPLDIHAGSADWPN